MQSLETVYRVNMGGPKVSPNNDNLSRNWQNDQKYILNPSVTKTVVYGKSINDKSKQNQQMEIGYYRGLSKEC
jgi:hypothetical protein